MGLIALQGGNLGKGGVRCEVLCRCWFSALAELHPPRPPAKPAQALMSTYDLVSAAVPRWCQLRCTTWCYRYVGLPHLCGLPSSRCARGLPPALGVSSLQLMDWDLLISASIGACAGFAAVHAHGFAARPGVGWQGLVRELRVRLFRRHSRIVYKDELV